MKSTKTTKVTAALASCSAGLFLAVLVTASPAGADPVDPGPLPPPAPVSTDPAPPPAATTVQSADTEAAPLPPNGVPHLASPDALPPGSTMEPQDNDSPNVSYLRDLWQAVQNHEISGKEALVMGLAQRGMNTPYPDQAPGPNVPVTPADPAQSPPAAPALPVPPAPGGPLPPTP
ncbi:MAG: hypothetical protein ABW001_04430 [Mycobacterium sp.]